MKLESFKEKNTKRKAIIIGSVFVVLLISVIVLIRSFALFETKQEYNVIKGSVGNYSPSDITIASYIDGSPSKTFPTKDSEYAVEKLECNNGARGLWNYTNWEVNLSNLTTTGTKCKVYFVKSYKENILNGTDPIISENLIPVTIENDGTVKKADMTSEWYKYENKIWANAVILESDSKVYQNGEVIPESNIESYFVWIPKYEYKLWNMGNYTSFGTNDVSQIRTIDIRFNKENTVDGASTCKTPMMSGETGNCSVGKYMTNPSFISMEATGLWVGKFETGYKGSINSTNSAHNEFNTSKVSIKPNIFAWNTINVSNAHLNSFNYQRSLDSHMMKNTEWGSVAYLSHSKYGINQKIRYNNNSAQKTGFAGAHNPTAGITNTNESCVTYPDNCNEYGTTPEITQPYNTNTGYLASTTGNISGIYDMSGGTQEWMLSVMKNPSGINYSGRDSLQNSGFNGPLSDENSTISNGIDWPNDKYVDIYNYSTNQQDYQRRILGDAIGELGPFYSCIWKSSSTGISGSGRVCSSWYSGAGHMLEYHGPFIARGLKFQFGVQANIFAFDEEWNGGGTHTGLGYRVVLAI